MKKEQYLVELDEINKEFNDLIGTYSSCIPQYDYRLIVNYQQKDHLTQLVNIENLDSNIPINIEILKKVKNEFNSKIAEDINLALDYKLNFKINQNQVGVLKEEDYPEELKRLILSMQKPSPDGKHRTKKETINENKIPVAFAIGFDGVMYVKRIKQIKLMSTKKMKNSYLAATKTHKITTLD